MLKRVLLATLFVFIFSIFVVSPAYAVCPVCTVAVGVGVGLSRWLGVDDTITGIWIGALVWSSSFWMANWLEKKQVNWPGKTFWLAILLYIFIFIPFTFSGFIGHPINKIWGIDKLVLGTILGSVLFLSGVLVDRFMRLTHNSKVYFPYQKVVAPVSLLVVGSLIFYFITKPIL